MSGDNMDGLIQGKIRQAWQLIRVADVIVTERQRKLDPAHVAEVRQSFASLGGQLQLQPIVVTGDLVLVDGRHRLEAAKLEGWEYISAIVLSGATEDDRVLLEAEANRVRLQLSPVELEEAWKNVYEPAFKARAKQRQRDGGARGGAARAEEEDKVTEDFSNLLDGPSASPDSAPVSLPAAAKAATGLSMPTINKITDIRALAESSTASEELRNAAATGLEKLKVPGAAVDTVHKALLKMQERERQQSMDPTEARRKYLEGVLDKTLTETTLFAEKLGGDRGQELLTAARGRQVASEQVRAIRVALTHGLSRVVAIECSLDGDPVSNLQRIGSEVTRMLSQLTIEHLDLEADEEDQ